MPRAAFPFALFALILLQALFVYGYVSHEHTVYFWDHAMYHGMARELAAAFRTGFSQGFGVLGQSLTQDYNYLFALPSLPVFFLFGDGRPVFLLVNFFVYFVAFEVAVALVLRNVFSLAWPTALVSGFAVCSLLPPLWLPLLVGYPDVAAAACVTFSLGLNVRAFNASFRSAILTGLLLGVAVLLRRHFAYAVAAFLIAAGFFGLFDSLLRTPQGRRGRAFLRFVATFGLCGAVTAGVVGLVAPVFFLNALTVDYGKLYLSYKKPVADFLLFALSGFGVLLSVGVFGGFILGARALPEARRPLAFVAATTAVWFVVWCAGPTQAGPHYLLHVLPVFAAVGLTGLCLGLWRCLERRRALLTIGVLALLLGANSAWALWLAPERAPPDSNGAPRLFAAPRPPVVRKDYEELVRLASYLDATTAPDDRIFVLGSSFVFNQDIVRAVNTDILNRTDVLFRFLQGPEIDSTHGSPLDAFAAANVYVVPDPPQYHLGPEAQKVVTAVARRFPPEGSSSGYFHKDVAVFDVDDGVHVSVWRRGPLPPRILHDALEAVRKTAPSYRQDWVALTALRQVFIETGPKNQTGIFASFDQQRSALLLFFDYPLNPGDYRLSFEVPPLPTCASLRFELSVLSANGDVLRQHSFVPAALQGLTFQTFTMPGSPAGAGFVRLHIKSGSGPSCVFALRQLSVESL
jgi:hypothetical protein